jgi:mRNA interferase MazF
VRRGEIYVADLEPVRGSEANKPRPVVIVSNDASNEIVERLSVGMVTVVPLSTNITHIYNFQVHLSARLTGLDQDCKAQAEQIRSISTNRIQGKAIGFLPPALIELLNEALKIHLSIKKT